MQCLKVQRSTGKAYLAHWQIHHNLLHFRSNLTSLRLLMINFSLKYSKIVIFLDIFCFESQKRCFQRFSVYSVLYSISVIFPCFLYCGKLATLYYWYIFSLTYLLNSDCSASLDFEQSVLILVSINVSEAWFHTSLLVPEHSTETKQFQILFKRL